MMTPLEWQWLAVLVPLAMLGSAVALLWLGIKVATKPRAQGGEVHPYRRPVDRDTPTRRADKW